MGRHYASAETTGRLLRYHVVLQCLDSKIRFNGPLYHQLAHFKEDGKRMIISRTVLPASAQGTG